MGDGIVDGRNGLSSILVRGKWHHGWMDGRTELNCISGRAGAVGQPADQH
jgi:hypothetical protein